MLNIARHRECLDLCLSALLAVGLIPASAWGAEPPRWNIVWVSCEDTSPDLGCYGDSYARTPILDALAAQGARYTRCFTHAPVCAPSRSGLILGMYPTTVGTHHMRSRVLPKADWRCFPAYLRDAGYYCTNNSKTDYNFPVPTDAWDENSPKAHFRNRPNKSQPFFAVFNFIVSHESQARATEAAHQKNTARLTSAQRHDPALAKLPAYYPDTPIVRQNWARCQDNVTAVDYLVGDMLKQLDDDGLADKTVVVFFGDHGRGLTRGKRWLYDSGLHVPLLVRWPGQIKPGTVIDDLTAFVDLGPSMLSIAGVKIPQHMQGQAFLGPQQAPQPREYVYAARDRMDERYDMIRAVRDRRYKYLRNDMPWKPYAQHVSYGEQMPIMQELRRLSAAGKLSGSPALFMQPTKPREELYDCDADPAEIHNLAEQPEHRGTLERLRAAHDRWAADTHDLGVLPESLMLARIAADPDHWREKLVSTGLLGKFREVAALGHSGNDTQSLDSQLLALLKHDEPAIRVWALIGLSQRPSAAQNVTRFEPLLRDDSSIVRVTAAEAIARQAIESQGKVDLALPILIAALSQKEASVALAASLALDELGEHARPAIDALKTANEANWGNDYVIRVSAHALEQLGEKPARYGNK